MIILHDLKFICVSIGEWLSLFCLGVKDQCLEKKWCVYFFLKHKFEQTGQELTALTQCCHFTNTAN